MFGAAFGTDFRFGCQKNFEFGLGKTTDPVSRPSATSPFRSENRVGVAAVRRGLWYHCATADAPIPMASVRMPSETSSPSSRMRLPENTAGSFWQVRKRFLHRAIPRLVFVHIGRSGGRARRYRDNRIPMRRQRGRRPCLARCARTVDGDDFCLFIRGFLMVWGMGFAV